MKALLLLLALLSGQAFGAGNPSVAIGKNGPVKIGEVLSATSTTSWSTSDINHVSMIIPKGGWLVSCLSHLGGDGTARMLTVSISPTSASPAGASIINGRLAFSTYFTTSGTGSVNVNSFPLNLLSDTIYYCVGNATSTSGQTYSNHRIQAIRIAP